MLICTLCIGQCTLYISPENCFLTRYSAFAPGPKLFPIDSSGNFQLAETHAVDTYKAMEKLLNTGKVKAIGVSNMNISRLKFLLSKVTITPAANQIESHPYLQQPELLSFCRSSGILVQAYSPLGNNVKGLPRAVDDPRVQAIAKRIGKEPGQLLICWGVQRGTNVLSKSVSQHRIEANFQDFVLAIDLIAELDSMDENRRLNGQLHWGIDPFDEVDQETVQSFARDAAPANKLKFVT
jgi:diketogulonate reductase-like aldo/keto reductase